MPQSVRQLCRQAASLTASSLGIFVALGLCACSSSMPRSPAAAPPPEPASPATSSAAPEPSSPADPGKPAAATPDAAPELSWTKPVAGVTAFDEAIEKVQSALADQGFGIITQIDVRAVMKKKLGIEMRPYRILGACNPDKAHQAIEAEPQMGLLLPCKVIVYQDEQGAFVVAFARPQAIFGLVNRPDLRPLAEEVEAAMRKAFDAL